MPIKLTKDAQSLLQDTYDLDGMEIPERSWEAPNIKELIDKELAEFGSARGPGNAWKRLTVTERGMAVILKEKHDV